MFADFYTPNLCSSWELLQLLCASRCGRPSRERAAILSIHICDFVLRSHVVNLLLVHRGVNGTVSGYLVYYARFVLRVWFSGLEFTASIPCFVVPRAHVKSLRCHAQHTHHDQKTVCCSRRSRVYRLLRLTGISTDSRGSLLDVGNCFVRVQCENPAYIPSLWFLVVHNDSRRSWEGTSLLDACMSWSMGITYVSMRSPRVHLSLHDSLMSLVFMT